MINMDNTVITGIGAVSPLGIGGEVLLKAVQDKTSGIKGITKFPVSQGVNAGEISGFAAEEYIKDQRFRRIADVSRYAIVAAQTALNDSGIEMKDYSPERIGLIMCVTHGAIGYSSEFHKELLYGGPQAASPALFSESVLNAPAGNVSNFFGIKGPVYTLVGGSTSVIGAIKLAEELLRYNRVDCCFVSAAEELNEIAFHTYARFGFEFNLGEGAGMLILERQKDALNKGHKIYGMIKASANGFCYKDSTEQAILHMIKRCLDKSGLTIKDIANIFINSSVGKDAIERLFMHGQKRLSVENITGLLGESFCAATIFHIIISSMMLYNVLEIKNAMINAVSIEGDAASLILSKVSPS